MTEDEANIEAFYEREFTAYNPPGSVGVSCNGRGQITALLLDEDALAAGDESLAEEIVAIAGLVREQYRMELRLFSLESLAAQGYNNTDRMDRFYRRDQKMPTPEEYREMERELASRYEP